MSPILSLVAYNEKTLKPFECKWSQRLLVMLTIDLRFLLSNRTPQEYTCYAVAMGCDRWIPGL
jgi:hypothetical protein